MTFSSENPLYAEFIDDFNDARNSFRGERVVKEKTTEYLPATAGQVEDGQGKANTKGDRAYKAYLKRAVFHDFMTDAVTGAIGIMHQKPASIELPERLEAMRESATLKGESLQMLLMRINEHQLVEGRLGLLLDLPPENQIPKDRGDTVPYIATYSAQNIINWDDGFRDGLNVGNLNLVVLDESGPVRNNLYDWEEIEKFRILLLGDPLENEGKGTSVVYRQVVTEDASAAVDTTTEDITPNIRGVTLNKIPFCFVNSKDILPEPDEPPLLGLVRLTFAIYRGEADYRQNLFMQGQDTLVIIGDDSSDDEGAQRTGAGAGIRVPLGGDVKYVGVSSKGLPEQRQALDNDKKLASQKGGQILDTSSNLQESGESRIVRVAAQTATLNQIALTGGFALEKLLKCAAEWVGADPDEVSVKPNLDFTHDTLTGQSLKEFMEAKSLGLKLSDESIHELMLEKNVTQKTFEEEEEALEKEESIPFDDNEGLNLGAE